MAYCKSTLGRVDSKDLEKFETYDDLLKELYQAHQVDQASSFHSFFSRFEPYLSSFRRFTVLLTAMMASTKTATIWGLTNLLIEISSKSNDISTKVLPWLEEMGSDLLLFNHYDWIFANNTELQNLLVMVFIDLIKFWALAVKYLRRSPQMNFGLSPWSEVRSQYLDTVEKIRKQTARVKEMAQAINAKIVYEQQAKLVQELEQRLEGTSISQPEDQEVSLPCNNLPFPRNPKFSGRKDLLTELHQRLDPGDDDQGMKSWCLWGMGGLGKTQVALQYAHERLEQETKAVFWINSDTPLAIMNGFIGIGLALNHTGVKAERGPDHNKYLIFNWLQRTSSPWLIVFDNVESPEHLRTFWPANKNGAILITSRYNILAFNPASGGSEIPVMNEEEGSELLTKLLARKDYTDAEIGSAKELSQSLGGLPLALNLMGGQIHRRGKRIEQFLDQYRKYSSQLHKASNSTSLDIYYHYKLDTVWLASFEPLEPESRTLLSILSFLAPDEVPLQLFLPEDKEGLGDGFDFCEDDFLLDEALIPLTASSLVGKSMTTDVIHLHRLVQEEYRNWIKPAERYDAFVAATRLLYQAFPKQAYGLPLRNEWDICKKYISHAAMLCTHQRKYKFKPVKKGDFEQFTRLLATCCWYLVETGSWPEHDSMIEVAEAISEDKEGPLYAQICNTAGVVEMERGHVAKAYPLILKARSMREKSLPENHVDLADSCTNLGNLMMTEFKDKKSLEEVERLFDRAIEIDKMNGDEHCDKIMHIRIGNNGVLYNLQGRYEKAIEYIEIARDYAIKLFGKDTHFDVTADYDHGKVLYDQGKYDDARPYFSRAEKVFVDSNPWQPAATAAHLKLACMDMRQGRVKDAIELLRKTLAVCTFKESVKGDRGDTARVMRRLSEALELDGQLDEAKQLHDEAESIRKSMQGDRFDELEDTEQAYNLLVYVAFW
ncbi:MAG: hypothetical protein M1840_000222 [Geoglossum simile]|nr:MAG: hypothetical protein M1840_000222 [Geoglossum simile]